MVKIFINQNSGQNNLQVAKRWKRVLQVLSISHVGNTLDISSKTKNNKNIHVCSCDTLID